LFIIILTLIVGTISFVSQYMTRKDVDKLVDDTRIAEFIMESGNAILMAQRAEKDYHTYYKTLGFEVAHKQYVNKLQTHVATIHENIKEIESLETSEEIIVQVKKIDTAVAEYENAFLIMVTLVEKRGHVDVGLEGQFRQKVHNVEDAINEKKLKDLMIGMLMIRRHEKDYLLRNDTVYVERLHEEVNQFKKGVQASNISQIEKEQLIKFIDDYQISFDTFVQTDEQIVMRVKARNEMVNETILLIEQTYTIVKDNKESTQNKIQETTQFVMQAVVLVSSIAVIVGLLIALYLSNSISQRLLSVTELISTIASKDLDELSHVLQQLAKGDLTGKFMVSAQPVQIESEDELGQMGHLFNQMVRKLHDSSESFEQTMINLGKLVDKVAEDAVKVGRTSNDLAITANHAGEAAGQVTNAIYEIAVGMTQQVESIAQATAEVGQVSNAIEHVSMGAQDQATSIGSSLNITNQITIDIEQVAINAQEGAEVAVEATGMARTGMQTVEKAIRSMEQIRYKVGSSSEKVKEMAEWSQQIGSVVKTIDEFATQTNLLALNAAIEASRAGEHGKGFGVVADHVRKLAENSANATQEVSSLIRNIQHTITEAVAAMNEGMEEVKTGVVHANNAEQSLNQIVLAVETVNQQVKDIAESAQVMSESSKNLLNSMVTVSSVVQENTALTQEMEASSTKVMFAIERIAKVSEESSDSVKNISAATEEMSTQVDEVSNSAQTLSYMAEVLQGLVAQFKLR